MMVFIDTWMPWLGDLLSLGGNIVGLILVMAFFMLTLIWERLFYLYKLYPDHSRRAVQLWLERSDRMSWYAQQYRNHLIARITSELNRNFSLIATIIKICPLLGLLGTVAGMLEVFDALAATGSNNPRSMAAGVSKAASSPSGGQSSSATPCKVVSYMWGRYPMRKLFLDNREDEESSVDITPMLDVVFIMLIFFIVTATFVKEAGIDVDKPSAATAIVQEKASILIAIDAENQVWVNRRQVDLRSVRSIVERLHAENPKGTLVIQADKESKNDILVQVMDASRRAGLYNIALAAHGP
jgi:biopolymer transport protein ExbD